MRKPSFPKHHTSFKRRRIQTNQMISRTNRMYVYIMVLVGIAATCLPMALGFAPVSKKASYPTTMSSSSSHHLIQKQQQTATTKFNYSSSKTRKNDRLCNCKLMSSLEQQPEDDTFSPPTTTTPTPAIQSNHIEQQTATTKFNYSSSKTRKNDRLCNCKLMSSLEQPEDDTFSPPTTTTTTTPTPAIQSNHIEQQEQEQNELYKTFQLWYKSNLPPKPEDQLVLAGDMFALFTYSFLEHIIDDAYVDAINSPDVTTITYASAHDPTLSGAMATIRSLPVWFDVVHSAYGPVLTSAFPMMHTSYVPALSCAGVAAVTMASCWIVSGYFTKAFVFSNTLCCDTNNAVVVAGKTYVGAAFLMVMVAVGSHLLLGGVDVLDTSSLLTKADVDYIFCSFSVVLFWRYTISWLLGTGS
mmetsp:Transcript_40172/g.60858  ORF Transcript_40172/g.60858 Transcript_40172/m.60858 type:complete len:412 (+) Transcript_40172:365-1600(+)